MNNLKNILKNFPQKRITVVGDVMLDKDVFGNVSRISPEALSFILEVEKESYSPGGAANVAANISSLGGKTSLFGFIGNDEPGRILKSLMEEKGIFYCFDESSKYTTLKIRPKTKYPLPVRIDYEDKSTKKFSNKTLEIMSREIKNSDIVLISDYAKGTITKELTEFLKSFNKLVIIDPKPQNTSFYSNAFLITPNEKEALEMSMQKEIYSAGRKLKENLGCNILVTRGEKGMTLFSDKEIDISTSAKEVFDVAGAGDTVIAAIALSLTSGASLEESALIANYAAGIAVEKAGTYQVKFGELENRICGGGKKLRNLDELFSIVSDLKKKGKRIVWTNGCFDLLHIGHKYSLEKAKEKGNILIVGLDSDESVRTLKGPERPYYSESIRAEMLSALEYVDYVTIFKTGEVVSHLKKLMPDVYVKSGDYTLETINQEERKTIESYGGEIYLPKGLTGFSTTDVVNRIRNGKSSNFSR